jgi:hypothetical protein
MTRQSADVQSEAKALSGSDRGKQISLAVFDNEPTARMAEQRLQANGIPCLVRSLQGGPGVWGSAYNLPHDLLVYERDEMEAREILDLIPLEITEREGPTPVRPQPWSQWMVIVGVVSVVVVLIMAVAVVRRIAE